MPVGVLNAVIDSARDGAGRQLGGRKVIYTTGGQESLSREGDTPRKSWKKRAFQAEAEGTTCAGAQRHIFGTWGRWLDGAVVCFIKLVVGYRANG